MKSIRSILLLTLLGSLIGGRSLIAKQHNHAPARLLKIYFIDVEGGQSTLFVTPEGHSLLIDAGSPGFEGRDANRIADAIKRAGLDRIDYLLLTHYHSDHAGGVPQLVDRIPVGTFIDHGPSRETATPPTVKAWNAYQAVVATGKYRHIIAHVGDILPIPGINVTAVSGDGEVIADPLVGAGQANQYCAVSGTPATDTTENGMSLGVLIRFGKLRILDLGDLTRDKELLLMCPKNKIGHVDILVVSHHGLARSSTPALVDAIRPAIAVVDNSEKKGNSTVVNQLLADAPGLQALWQLHFSIADGGKYNTRPERIANLQGEDQGNNLELSATQDGRVSIYNPRTKAVSNYDLSDSAH